MNPNPLSVTSRLIVPFMCESLLWRVDSRRGHSFSHPRRPYVVTHKSRRRSMNHCSLTAPSVLGSTDLLRRKRLNQNVSPPNAASSDAHPKYDRIIISWGEHQQPRSQNIIFYRAARYCGSADIVARTALTRSPICNDRSKIAPTRRPPGSLWRATAAKAADAMQPQLAQSGFPPNWHGVMRVLKSADTPAVVRAKTHSCGECGGAMYDSIMPFGMRSFGHVVRSRIRSSTTRRRSDSVSRSADSSPTCGVYRLIHNCETASFADQKFTNPSRDRKST